MTSPPPLMPRPSTESFSPTTKIYRIVDLDGDRSIQPWFFKEEDAARLYPEFLPNDARQVYPMADVWHGRNAYRAADWPKLRTSNTDRRRLTFLASMQVSADLQDSDHQPYKVTKGCGIPLQPKGRKEDPDPRTTRLRLRPDTQHPSIQIDLKMPEVEEDITCDIYATDMAIIADTIQFEAHLAGQAAIIESDIPDDADCRALYASNELLLIKVRIADGAKLQITGVTASRLDLELQRSKASPECQVIDLLRNNTATRRTITFATSYCNKDLPFLNSLLQVFSSLCFAAASCGNYWWYRLSANMKLSHPEFPFHLMPFPRWLGSHFEVESDVQGSPIETTAIKCLPFMCLGQSRLPVERTPRDVLIFEHQLGNARDMANRLARCQQLSQTLSNTMAVFELVRDGAYIAFVTVHGGDGDPDEDEKVDEVQVLPQAGTKLEMGVKLDDQDYQLRGGVVDDMTMRDNVSFAVVVTTMDTRFTAAIQQTSGPLRVALKFDDSLQSYQRTGYALSRLWHIPETGHGIDISNILLCKPTARTTNWMRDSLMSDAVWSEYQNHINKFGLDESQLLATENLVTSPGGFHLVIGAAGTGKTKTLLAFSTGLLAALPRVRIIITAPSNEALNNIMRMFEALDDNELPQGLDRLSVVRFTSAFVASQKLPSHTGTDTGGLVDDADPHVETSEERVHGETTDEYFAVNPGAAEAHDDYVYQHMIRSAQIRKTSPNVEHSFAYKKLQWIRSIADDCLDTELQSFALEFLTMLDAIDAANGNDRRHLTNEDRQALREMDEYLSSAFLEQKVHVILCTNNSSAHPTLRAYNPEVLIMDEAGMANVADAAVPLMSHTNLQSATLFGDHKQLTPVVINATANEAVERMRTSILEQCHDDSTARFSRSQLRIQYRMQADLSEFPRTNGYHGQVSDDPSRIPTTAVQEIVRRHTMTLGGLIRNSSRFAIDCPCASTPPGRGDSPFNTLECQRAVEVARMMLCDGQISPKDIVIMSPYIGQVRKIKLALLMQIKTPSLREIEVRTTRGMQGSEAEIIILSLVSNRPGFPHRTGFITNRNLMLAALTRARSVLVVLGNFAAWRGVIKGQMESTNGDKYPKTGPLNREPARLFREFVWELVVNNDIISHLDWDRIAPQIEINSARSHPSTDRSVTVMTEAHPDLFSPSARPTPLADFFPPSPLPLPIRSAPAAELFSPHPATPPIRQTPAAESSTPEPSEKVERQR